MKIEKGHLTMTLSRDRRIYIPKWVSDNLGEKGVEIEQEIAATLENGKLILFVKEKESEQPTKN